jgi:outer membrane protein OmpA-like peptidoglycan-associated protein
MENLVRPDTRGVIESISAKYELLPRGMYTSQGRAPGFTAVKVNKQDPFELYEAENAVQLARVAGADRYASESFQKANDALRQAVDYQNQKPGQKPVITMAREAVVRAEDARLIALRRQRDEAQANERQAALARENAEKARAEEARLRADQEASQRAQAEADRRVAERARADAQAAAQAAETRKQEAERATLDADRARRAAEDARQAAVVQQQQLAADAERARQAAADADRQRQDAERGRQDAERLRQDAERQRHEADRGREQAERDQVALRQQLLTQFNTILQTRDTARGLIVNMSDVLFDTAQYSLKPGAREKLAKVSGIILGHPGLRIEVEGHTDSVGGDDYNMKLSENRASSVRSYLVSQGIDQANVTARGFGKAKPVADNSTAAGRQVNRRVELVVSGEILGTTLSSRTSSSGPVTSTKP